MWAVNHDPSASLYGLFNLLTMILVAVHFNITSVVFLFSYIHFHQGIEHGRFLVLLCVVEMWIVDIVLHPLIVWMVHLGIVDLGVAERI